jgi:hypothetical protein
MITTATITTMTTNAIAQAATQARIRWRLGRAFLAFLAMEVSC